jgi:hypothetical protein
MCFTKLIFSVKKILRLLVTNSCISGSVIFFETWLNIKK